MSAPDSNNSDSKENAHGPGAIRDLIVTSLSAEEDKTLSPEQAERTLRVLADRFVVNRYLHEDLDWVDVESALKEDPKALWSIAQMEILGHEPDVYHSDKSGFYVGTCSREVPASTLNCVYDESAREYLEKNYPEEVFKGVAMEAAEAMGIQIMNSDQHRLLLRKGSFDKSSDSFLLIDEEEKKFLKNKAVCASKTVFFATHGNNIGWRGLKKILWA